MTSKFTLKNILSVIFCCYLWTMSVGSYAQTLGPYTLYDHLVSSVHPNGCSSNHVHYWPQDSIWVNLADNSVGTGTFGLAWTDQAGDDILLETGFHAANYNVRLMLQGGGFSAVHPVAMADWTFNMNVNWKYMFGSCGNGSTTNGQEYYLPLDFAADFGLGAADIVVGLEITFLTTSGAPDFAGAYMINPPTVLLDEQWLDFTADLMDQTQVQLNWSLALEFDNDYFEVLRSGDAVNWETVSVIKSRGNSPQPVNYSEVDKKALNGTSYYRVKMVSLAGEITYSDIRSITINKDNSSVQIAPNPATAVLNILNLDAPFDYIIYNSLGQVQQSGQVTNGNSIDIEKLGVSTYQITLEKDGVQKVLKWVKY